MAGTAPPLNCFFLELFNLFTPEELEGIEVPRQFTWPFCYEPHPLARLAVSHTFDRLEALHREESEAAWLAELDSGKMLGVLVVSDDAGHLGWLAAFSGTVAGSYRHAGFVPPVDDLLAPGHFYTAGMARIDSLTARINAAITNDERHRAAEALARHELRAESLLTDFKRMIERDRTHRREMRQSGLLDDAAMEALENDSKYQRAELKRLRQRLESQREHFLRRLSDIDSHTAELRRQREQLSQQLQLRLFESMMVSNARGERLSVLDAVHTFQRDHGLPQALPPGGTGECAAPKLLQYAFSHGLRPLCMAEVWWGRSSTGELHRHGHYYPSCSSKCKPLLHFMLQGLDVEPDPLDKPCDEPLTILHDDEWLAVVNKPAGMLSQEGHLENVVTVEQAFIHAVPQPGLARVVHRLDMDTSGVMIIAKTVEAYTKLQRLFHKCKVDKRYIAVLDGDVSADKGTVNLPLAPDINDRPRQKVDRDYGKVSITNYKVLDRTDGRTRVEFAPVTGRTHQLRVHAASVEGLNAPIVGDRLYGIAGPRLLLHAVSISFTHPFTGRDLTITSPVPF